MHLYGVLCGARPIYEEMPDLDRAPEMPAPIAATAESERLIAVENRLRAIADAVAVLAGEISAPEADHGPAHSATERVERILRAIGFDVLAKEN